MSYSMEGNNSKIFLEIQSDPKLREKFRVYTTAPQEERERYRFLRTKNNKILILDGDQVQDLIARLKESIRRSVTLDL